MLRVTESRYVVISTANNSIYSQNPINRVYESRHVRLQKEWFLKSKTPKRRGRYRPQFIAILLLAELPAISGLRDVLTQGLDFHNPIPVKDFRSMPRLP